MKNYLSRAPRSAGVLIALLTASIFINYIDRTNLAVSAPLLLKELHYSNAQLGLMSSAFFWTYSLLQLCGVSGWIADHFQVSKVFAWAFLLWSLATAATGLVSTFAAFFAMRLLLGAGESLAYPCYSRMIAMEVPQHLRGRANALLDAGSKLGPALGTLLGGLLLERYGWRAFFVVLGAAGLLWLLPWRRFKPASPVTRSDVDAGAYPALQMFGFRSAWGAFGGHFCGNYFWFFLVTWLPLYLVKERGLSIKGMATVGSVAYLVIAAATLSAGWLSDTLLKRGISVTRVRKTAVVAGLLASSVVLPAAFVNSQRLGIVLLYASCVGFGTYTSNHWTITQTLAGPMMAGRWTSVQNGFGNFSGILASWLTGFLVDRHGSFRLAFFIAAGFAIGGAALWGFVVGPVQQVRWRRDDVFQT